MNPLDYANKIAYSSEETLMFTYDVAKKLAHVNGVFVECGVAAGAQIIAMAHAAPDKTIYAFDSFQGIPLPSNRDDQYPGIRTISKSEQKKLPNPGEQVLESSGATSVSEADFLSHLISSGVNHQNVKIVPGWFEHTVRLFGGFNVQISLLRLDGDLYNSTFECLKYLFPKVIEGGYVIIDDWMLKGCREACIEYFELVGYKPTYKFVSNIVYFIK
jgi:O-methyltransferase